MVNKKIAELLTESNAIEFGHFVLASGATSTYYIDIKKATTNPVVLKAIGEEIANHTAFDMVAGVAVGGVPLAVATSICSEKPYAIIRSETKDHGISETVIGDVKGHRVLLVEDVTTSGGSAIYGVRELRAAGAVVDTVITVVDRSCGADAALGEEQVQLIPLVTIEELIKE